METIVSYVSSEQRTFAEVPLTPPDSLVLSTLAYFDYRASGLMGSAMREPVLLHDVVALSDWSKLTRGSWLTDAKDTHAFLRALMASRRYRGVKVAFHVNERPSMMEKQFSAVALLLDDGATYLAFRGTDGSFAGWKEDFNLCFKDVIPSQSTAVAYASGVASALPGPLYLGGHSKGGNLAEYAALVVDGSTFGRIRGVFNHDGPSFLGDPSPRIDTPAFQSMLHKTVPESSAFGMMLERRSDYRVVQSNALSVFQHEPFSWLVHGRDFLYQEKLNKTALFFDEALDAWLRSKTPAERERFIDTLYELFASTKANSWSEYRDEFVSNTRCLLDTRSRLDAETKRFVLQTFGGLATILKEQTFKAIRPSPPSWLPWRRESYDATAAAGASKGQAPGQPHGLDAMRAGNGREAGECHEGESDGAGRPAGTGGLDGSKNLDTPNEAGRPTGKGHAHP